MMGVKLVDGQTGNAELDRLYNTVGNLTRAALELAISRPTLYELMDKLGMSRK
jgi:DNA-binding NtrC family response regulator